MKGWCSSLVDHHDVLCSHYADLDSVLLPFEAAQLCMVTM